MKRIVNGYAAILFAAMFTLSPGFAKQQSMPSPSIQPPSPSAAATSGSATPQTGTTETGSAPQAAPSVAPKTAAPVLSPALLAAQELYRSGKLAEAFTAYNALMSAGGPDAANAYAGLTRVYLKQRKPADALAAAQKAVALSPDLAAAHTALGEAYFRTGKLVDAEREFRFTLINKRTDARALLGLNRIYRATSNYKSAKIALDVAHSYDPGDPEIRRAWLGTLPLKERMQAVRDFLAESNTADDESRKNLERSLTVLQDESNRPVHGCHQSTRVSSTVTPLVEIPRLGRGYNGYGLQVKFNDSAVKLKLDTGASGIVLSSKLAEKAGVQHVVDHGVGGIGNEGEAPGYTGFANSIQIGELQFESCYITVVDSTALHGEDGLIGADVFQSYLVDIGFPDKQFKLSELPKRPDEAAEAASLASGPTSTYHAHDRYIAPEMQGYTRIYRFGHMLLIPTSVDEHPEKLFLIDTGAFDNTISPEAAKESTSLFSNGRTYVYGLNGLVNKAYLTEVTLAFAHFKRKKTIVAFDLSRISDGAGTEIAGILGFNMLGMLDIKIDYRDGLVDFVYDASRQH